jgi:hypothetical protein
LLFQFILLTGCPSASYFDHLHHVAGILDPCLHTVAYVRQRSALLFNSVCSVAAQFVQGQAALCRRLNRHNEGLIVHIISQSCKSIEIVQGLIVYCSWLSPSPRMIDELTFTYLTIAVSMAFELGLSLPTRAGSMSPSNLPSSSSTADMQGGHNRLVRNRERCWLTLFVYDRGCVSILSSPLSGF